MNEPRFVIYASDRFGPQVVRFYASLLRAEAATQKQLDDASAAEAIAERMALWRTTQAG